MLKKFLKIVGVVAFALIALIILVLVASLRIVDSKHFTERDYYQSTIARLNDIMATTQQTPVSQLHVGAAKAGLTPPIGAPLAGYGARKGEASTGVHDSLFVRVLALESGGQQAFIVGYDALLLHPEVTRRLEKKVSSTLDISPDQILYTATHTHSGPGGWGVTWADQQFAGPKTPVVASVFIDSTLAAIKQAQSNLQPGQFSTNTIDAPQFIRNRLVGDDGMVDDDLITATFRHNKKAICTFATYSAHATVISHRNMEFSGDYPGYFERALESDPGGVALFAAAGLGSHSYRGEGEGFQRAKNIGAGLADSVRAHLESKTADSMASLRAFRVPVDLAKTQVRLTQKICLAPWLANRLLQPAPAFIQVVALNDFIIIGSPGEFSGELALRVKETAQASGKTVTVTSFNGCYIGYVTPSEYYVLDEYETKLMSWFGAYTGDYLTAVMQRIVKNI